MGERYIVCQPIKLSQPNTFLSLRLRGLSLARSVAKFRGVVKIALEVLSKLQKNKVRL
jgi:hypothetical protein